MSLIEFVRGDTRTFEARVFTDSTKTTPQSLANAAEITFTGRRGTPAGTVAFAKTLTDGDITVTDEAGGVISIALAAADTDTLPARDSLLAYDLEIQWTGGGVITVDDGQLRVRSDVSY